MGIVNLMADADAGTARHDYQVSMYGKADEITGLFATDKVDVALIPCNLAAVLYQKLDGAVQVAGINTLGVLYFVETGDTIHSVEDLRGKTIYTTGKGTTPEFALNYVLSKNGIDPVKDATIEYKSESTEVAAMLAGGDDIIAMLPQPYVATVMAKNDQVHICPRSDRGVGKSRRRRQHHRHRCCLCAQGFRRREPRRLCRVYGGL